MRILLVEFSVQAERGDARFEMFISLYSGIVAPCCDVMW